MGKRGVLVVGVLLAVTLWPAMGGAADDPPPPTTVVAPEAPATTVPGDSIPDSTVPSTTEPKAEVPTTEDRAPSTDAPSTVEGSVPRTLTATPAVDLVHDQVVTLRGAGWPGGAFMGAAQCIQGTTTVAGCGPVKYFDATGQGSFQIRFRVSVILDTSEGTFDCRVDTCVIGANFQVSQAGARRVILGFDPAGPDPSRRTVTVDPTTNLVDGQEVRVTGEGFEVIEPGFGGFAEALQCVLPATSRQDCDPATNELVRVGRGGRVDEMVPLDAVLELSGGTTHDCRAGGCALVVTDYRDTFAESALVPLAFDPLGPLLPPPTLVATPSTGLVDGDIITLTGTGWDAGYLVIQFCRRGAVGFEDCSYRGVEYIEPHPATDFTVELSARTVLELAEGDRVDCRVDPCSIVVSPEEEFSRAVETPIDYDPAGGLLTTTIEVTPSKGLVDGQEVTVTGNGARPGSGLFVAQCVAPASSIGDCDEATLDSLRSSRREPVGVPFSGRTEVRRHLRLIRGGVVDCAIEACVLVASSETDFARVGRAPIRFALADAVPGAPGPVTAAPPFTG